MSYQIFNQKDEPIEVAIFETYEDADVYLAIISELNPDESYYIERIDTYVETVPKKSIFSPIYCSLQYVYDRILNNWYYYTW